MLNLSIYGRNIPNMEIQKITILHNAIDNILRALCKILLRYSISSSEFVERFKRIYVETARDELGLRGRRANKSRIAAATGLSRKEVARLCEYLDQTNDEVEALNLNQNRSIRLIHAWQKNIDLRNSDDSISPLQLTGAAPSFEQMVKDHCGDIPFRAMLKELQRAGVVELDEADRVHLNEKGFIPAKSESDKLNLLGLDVGLLIKTIDNNLQSEVRDSALYQRKVAYRGLNEKGLQLIEEFAHDQGQKLLEKLNALLPEYGIKDSEEKSHFAGLSIYTFKETE